MNQWHCSFTEMTDYSAFYRSKFVFLQKKLNYNHGPLHIILTRIRHQFFHTTNDLRMHTKGMHHRYSKNMYQKQCNIFFVYVIRIHYLAFSDSAFRYLPFRFFYDVVFTKLAGNMSNHNDVLQFDRRKIF